MIFDPFLTLGYVEDIKVLVQPSNTVPYSGLLWATLGYSGLLWAKILVTSQEAKFLFSFLGPFGAWALDWDLASGLSIVVDHVVNIFQCRKSISIFVLPLR